MGRRVEDKSCCLRRHQEKEPGPSHLVLLEGAKKHSSACRGYGHQYFIINNSLFQFLASGDARVRPGSVGLSFRVAYR